MTALIRMTVGMVVVCWTCEQPKPLSAFKPDSPDCDGCLVRLPVPVKPAAPAKPAADLPPDLADWWDRQKALAGLN